MAHKALYLRYRPKRFGEVKGQQHVVKAIQAALRDGKVGHAYLLHGPRGTGKTTTARLLAKALNCTDISSDGEPCCACESCVSIEENRSFDLHELDAASNNKVDDIRSLLERVGLATPGRAKVYLLDEVHMLTPGAENALLKTLEEPPAHVTWVMATTEPHKVAQTIRSRCQVFELSLLGSDPMAEHVRYVATDAGLDVSDDVVDYVVAVGAGSVRDTLSALDGVMPGVEVPKLDSSIDDILTAIADQDPSAALAAVGDAMGRGRAPHSIGESALAGLRDGFLVKMGTPPPRLSERERARAERIAHEMRPGAMTNALETLGSALINMRQAPDPRVDIEVALVRICQPETDDPMDALRKRLDRLETQVSALGNAAATSDPRAGAGPLSRRTHQADRPAGGGTPGTPVPDVPPIPGTPPVPNPPPIPGPPPVPSTPPDGPTAERSQNRETRTLDPDPNPVAKARQVLRKKAGSAYSMQSRQHTRTSPEGWPAAPPPVPPIDPTSLHPKTPTEVVHLAEHHLGLSKTEIVSKAKAMLPQKKPGEHHDPADLQELWNTLISESASKPPTATDAHQIAAPAAESVDDGGTSGVYEAVTSEQPKMISPMSTEDAADTVSDLTDTVSDPTDTDDIEAKIVRAFPGTEFSDLPGAS